MFQKYQAISKFLRIFETFLKSEIIAEKYDFSIRGRLGSILPLARNVGVMFGFCISAIIEYKYMPYIFISIPIIYLILLLTLPNTPQYYLKKGMIHVSG